MENLRVRPEHDLAQVERSDYFTFSFEGQPIRAYAGETIGAALLAAGLVTFRTTRMKQKPRGIFCGIGICFDCLIVVDGRLNQRACVTPARPAMAVHVQHGSGEVMDGD
jgi:predicted molibdopterin-dependent oxidoreductase YjgC